MRFLDADSVVCDNSEGYCETSSSICDVTSSGEAFCQCKGGFVNNPQNPRVCQGIIQEHCLSFLLIISLREHTINKIINRKV